MYQRGSVEVCFWGGCVPILLVWMIYGLGDDKR